MSQIINQLATIQVSDDVLKHLDINNLYESFHDKYRKLDDLKKFRSDYEQKGAVMRWWHNDKLRDAQLDSAEVQAEFSKTLGQLMMLGIMQSRRLTEQQGQLNEQQKKLQSQANGIAEQADVLQRQHVKLAQQSHQLENLVHDYFALKGLTEEGAQKLIAIANEVRTTKESMLFEVDQYSQDMQVRCADALDRLQAFSAEADARIQQAQDKNQQAVNAAQQQMHEALGAQEANLKQLFDSTLRPVNQSLDAMAQSQRDAQALHQSRHAALQGEFAALAVSSQQQLSEQHAQVRAMEQQARTLEAQAGSLASELSSTRSEVHGCQQHQQAQQQLTAALQRDLNQSLARVRYLAAGLSVSMLGLVGVIGYLVKLA